VNGSLNGLGIGDANGTLNGHGIADANGNGDGHGIADADGNGYGYGSKVYAEALHGAATTGVGSSPSDAAPRHGAGLIRYGVRDIGTGLADLSQPGLGLVRRHLPRRVRTISQGRLVLVLVLASALILAVVVVGVSVATTVLSGPTSVVVAPVQPAVIDNQPGGVGSISAAPQDIATVALNVQGVNAPIEITAVDVLANQLVAAGAPLVQLNPVPFEQNMQQIRLTLQQDEDTLSSAVAAAAAASSSAGGYLSVQIPTLQGQVALDQQLLQIAKGNSTSITAPIAGYVSQVRVAPGQIVSPGSTLIQVVNPSQVVVNAGMQLSDLQSIAVGDNATITPSQLPDVHLHGKVVAVSAAATGDGLEGTVVVSAPNLTAHPVPIGTQSIVNVVAPLHAKVSVPTLAVLNVQIAPVVGVIRNNRIHFQPVEIGASDGKRTQILSGLHPGERVAVSNVQLLTDGDKVRQSSGGQ
jgi:RND family efflux transporter MFP subunit